MRTILILALLLAGCELQPPTNPQPGDAAASPDAQQDVRAEVGPDSQTTDIAPPDASQAADAKVDQGQSCGLSCLISDGKGGCVSNCPDTALCCCIWRNTCEKPFSITECCRR